MILKITRLSRRKNEWVSFVKFPETYSFRQAFRVLGNPKNGINIRRAKIEQIFDTNDVNVRMRFYDVKTSRVTHCV